MDSSTRPLGPTLSLGVLMRLAEKPALFEAGEPVFWNDPHISKGMLEAHLNPSSDAATRKHETVERTVEWLTSHLSLAPGMAVLDLGCGPGLYCSKLRRKGLIVTGMDYSARSLDYAKKAAAQEGLDIEYVYRDYLTMDYLNRFDAVFMIYCDFGVLKDADRDELLERVWRALVPGGLFVFDVWTDRFGDKRETSSWEVKPKGFWSPTPYLGLYNTYYYPEEAAYVDQYIIINPDSSTKVYRIWERAYTPDTIARALSAKGFEVGQIWGDLTGTPYREESDCIGVICRKV